MLPHPHSRRQILTSVKYLTFNLNGLESHLIPLCMGYQGLQNLFSNWCCNQESKMAAKMAANLKNFYSRWTRESPNTTLYGLSTAAKPFLKMALQSGNQNTRWPPKWPLKYLSFNLDALESHLIPFCMGYQGMQNHS